MTKPLTVSIMNKWDNEITNCIIEYTELGRSQGVKVQLYDERDHLPYATVSAHVPGIVLADNQFVFKNYGENEGMLRPFLEERILKLTGLEAKAGYVLCPIVEIRKWR